MSRQKADAMFDDLLRIYPPHERGARSPHAGVQAFLKAQSGFPVYCEGVSMENATTDLADISSVFSASPRLSWYIRAKAVPDNLVCLKFASAADRVACERENGRLSQTQVVAREGGTEFWLYQRRQGDPIFRLNTSSVPGANAIVSGYCQLAGNVHRKSKQIWYWRDGCAPGEIMLAFLPPSWIASLPRRVACIETLSACVTPRPEFEPRQARGWNDWHDINEAEF